MNISFFSLVAGHSLNLLFNHGTQRLNVYDLLALNTLVNALPNGDETSKMSNLGADYLLRVRRLEVINKPLDHLILHHGGCTCAANSRHLWAYS